MICLITLKFALNAFFFFLSPLLNTWSGSIRHTLEVVYNLKKYNKQYEVFIFMGKRNIVLGLKIDISRFIEKSLSFVIDSRKVTELLYECLISQKFQFIYF